MQIRYALLVGIDHYPNDNARGSEVYLDDLKGCVNDVQSLQKVLESEYGFKHITTLVSPSKREDSQNSSLIEAADRAIGNRLPTFSHIREEFEAIQAKANEGDLFFFHFSGHGAKLDRVKNTPYGRFEDPSLMTADYCCGGPALRGWQLNYWLKKLHEKGVQVVVSLDSCYSGGSWRGDDGATSKNNLYRTPKYWPPVPNLPADEEAASMGDEEHNVPMYRDAHIAKTWSINPEAFTLMTACTDDQRAGEVHHNGVHRGAFTYGLLEYLKDNRYHVTYRMAQDYLRDKLDPQTPTTHGRDRFLFFGNSEPFHPTRIRVKFVDGSASIPFGRAHGIHEGAEFLSFHSTSGPTFSVDSVEEFKLTISHFEGIDRALEACGNTVTESRWSLGKDYTLRLLLDSDFEPEFQTVLQQLLQNNIVNKVEIIQNDKEDENNTHRDPGTDESTMMDKFWRQLFYWFSHRQNTDAGESVEIAQVEDDTNGNAAIGGAVLFQLRKTDNQKGIDIIGPESLVQYRQSVSIKGDMDNASWKAYAAKVALSLNHMIRFEHTLQLRPKRACEDELPFAVSLAPVDGKPEKDIYPSGQTFEYRIRNTGHKELYFALFNITLGLQIQQIYPESDSQCKLFPATYESLRFTTSIPNVPPNFEHLCQRGDSFRDTLRTLVSTGSKISWKLLEMPSIWEAVSLKATEIELAEERNVTVASKDVEWWVCDRHVVTSI